MTKKLVLIDSNALVHRAFHALPPLSAPDGRPTNAVYGFTSVFLKMLQDLQPDYIAATFDLAAPTFRHIEYEDYKGKRTKAPNELYAQIPMVKEMLTAFGVPIFEKEGYEADDLIGTIAEQTRVLPDLQTIIVTGDLDTLQLVHDTTVVIFTLRKGMTDTIIYDEDGVRERYGLAPSQVVDFKGLKGDPSDNIPGVPGIGEKTAITLVQKFGSLEHLYDELETADLSPRLKEKLISGKDSAFFSKKLATIVRDVPVTFSPQLADWRVHANATAIEERCRTFGFSSLIQRIDAVLGTGQRSVVAPELSLRKAATTDDLPDAPAIAVHAIIEQSSISALYLTTDGASVWELTDPNPASMAKVIAKYHTIIGHGLKPLVRCVEDLSLFSGKELIDTSIGAWLVRPDVRDHSLERVYLDVVAQPLPQQVTTWPLAIWRLHPLIWDKLKDLNTLAVFNDMEMPLIPVLARMERIGIRVDAHTIDDLTAVATREINRLERKIHALAGGEFNINSPSQLAEILFTKLAIRGRVRRTSGGAPSTAAPELEKLRDEHPIVELILEYRELAKLKSTYIDPFPTLIATDGRIHTTYNQTGTATGRLSSSDPNLQNIPTRTELGQQFRAAFIADPGWKLVSFDYSQLELRIVAHIAHDETMIAAFRDGEDIHTRTASEVFGIAPAQVTRDMRRQAKVLNFGIIYGMGVLGFARAAGINREQAQQFIDEYFARFSGVAAYMAHTKQEVYEHGFVTTLLGRRRPLPDITSRIQQLAAAAERMAINHPIQGTGADMVKIAMIQIDEYLRQHATVARLLLQMHDELVFELEASAPDDIIGRIKQMMETVYPLDVPLVVDVKIGSNWAAMKPMRNDNE